MAVGIRTRGIVLLCVLCFTTTSYVFFSERLGDSGDPSHRKLENWAGPMDAQFNWCEPDHVVSDWIAEPGNTFSSLLYLLPLLSYAVVEASGTSRTTVLDPWNFRVFLPILALTFVGLGSMAFHAMLNRLSQLGDELPMYGLVLSSALAVQYPRSSPPKWLAYGSAVWFAVVVSTLLTTHHSLFVHKLLHGLMSAHFSACFLFILLTADRRSDALAEQTASPQLKDGLRFMGTYYFPVFVLAVVGWVVDNFMCAYLHMTPITGYPYLHALCWHGLTALGCTYIHAIVVLDYVIGKGHTGVEIKWLLGIVPVVIVRKSHAV